MSLKRLPSKYARDMDRIYRALGYTLERSSGHLVYVHPDFDEPLTSAATPGDSRAMANALAPLKRRHPEFFRVAKAPDRPARRSRKPRTRQPTAPTFEGTAPIARSVSLNTQPMRCTSCARPFQPLSTVAGRPCSACGGDLAVEATSEAA
jgi:predicted RNA-binding Zn-ribbon protein involved in translation (DUF1610 family)